MTRCPEVEPTSQLDEKRALRHVASRPVAADWRRNHRRQTSNLEVAEDKFLGDYRWLLVRAPDNREVCLNLEMARTDEEKALIGRQAAGQPLFSLSTDDCHRDYDELRRRGVNFLGEPKTMPYGTGVMMQDLCGNHIYLSQEPA